MIGQMLIAATAVLTLTAGADPAPASPKPPKPPATANKGAPNETEKRFTDHEGNKLKVVIGEGGKVVRTEAKDSQDRDLEVVQMKLQDLSVCTPRPGGTQFCQPLSFMSEGAFIKMGTASCTCCSVGGFPFCYGTTCR